MNQLFFTLLLLPSIAYAKEDIECAKKNTTDHAVHCNFEKAVTITRITINGGECGDFTANQYIPAHHHWIVPNTKSCSYTSGLTLQTNDGKIHKFAPL